MMRVAALYDIHGKRNILQPPSESEALAVFTPAELTRREALRLGMAAALLPVVHSSVAPSPAVTIDTLGAQAR